MSRRDTIIVAVLVNAALLMILFATAIRTGSPDKQKPVNQLAATPEPPRAAPKEDLLDQYLTSIPILTETEHEEIVYTEEIPLVAAPVPSKPVEHVAVAPPPAPKPVSNSSFVQVTVKKGDFLEKIAKANNTTVAAIMKANNMTSTQLKVGQVIKVPLSGSSSSPIETRSSSSNSEGEYYVVKEGDSPWLIASKNHVKVDDLLRLNGLDEQKARRLRPGDRLKIR